jgi:hypothetical protein
VDALIGLEQAAARWLLRDVRRRTLEKSVRTAYATFARRHPAWVAALFDEHFVLHHLLPQLAAAEERGWPLTPAAVAEQWARHVGGSPELRRTRQPKALAMACAFLELVAQARTIGYDWRAAAPSVEAAG